MGGLEVISSILVRGYLFGDERNFNVGSYYQVLIWVVSLSEKIFGISCCLKMYCHCTTTSLWNARTTDTFGRKD